MSGAPLPLDTRRWGSGEPRVLLLHGISSSAEGWWRVGGDLAELGWAVVAADLRGHGNSPGGHDYRLASYARDVLALGDGWDAVVGHSLGGAVATVASTASPQWTAGLVLQDPVLLVADSGRDEIVRTLTEPYRQAMTPAAIAVKNPGWSPEDCRIKAEALRLSDPEMVQATFEDNNPWNLLAEVADLPCPVTILGSDPEAGGILAVAIGEWLGTQPGAEYRLLEGAGHSAHRDVDGYGRYLEALLRALERIREVSGS
jgi:pimeloyl-ACP methyl ester carboxylesterase